MKYFVSVYLSQLVHQAQCWQPECLVRSIWRQYGLDMELTATEFLFVGITYISALLQHTKSIEKCRWGKTVKNDFKN